MALLHALLSQAHCREFDINGLEIKLAYAGPARTLANGWTVGGWVWWAVGWEPAWLAGAGEQVDRGAGGWCQPPDGKVPQRSRFSQSL